MKKITKSKAKAKPKKSSAKKTTVKKTVSKKSKVKVKPVAKVKAKPVAKVKAGKKVKVKPVVKVKAKAQAKSVVKAKSTFSKTNIVKEKPATNVVAKPVLQKEKEPVKKVTVAPLPKPAMVPTSNKMPYQRDEGRKLIRPQRKVDPNKTRYSDVELEEFRTIINKKLEDAKRELTTLQAQLTSSNDHGTDDTANTFKMLEDGSDSLAKEEAGQLASRQRKFIEQLENALVRIENKTYGVCRVTGKLIPKERLRAVPHTTQSIEAKLNQYRD